MIPRPTCCPASSCPFGHGSSGAVIQIKKIGQGSWHPLCLYPVSWQQTGYSCPGTRRRGPGVPAVPPPSASQPSILLEQASLATDPLSVRKPEVGKASIRQGNHPYYQVAGKPPIRQPPQPTHQLPIIQMRKPVRSSCSSVFTKKNKIEIKTFAPMKTVVFIVGFFFTPIVLWTSTRNCEVWYSIRNEIIHQIVN